MSVSNGQPANQSTFNTAFVSRTAAQTDTASKLDLLNTDTASGPSITNVQATLNGSKITVNVSESIVSNGEITIADILGNQTVQVQGDSGAQVASSTPFGNAFTIPDGAVIKVVGQDDTNTLQLLHNDADYGCILNGNATLFRFDVLELIWNQSELRFIEANRSF